MKKQRETVFVKPVLRWAGGKTWMLEKIQKFLPKHYTNYYEPFIGGASVFLNLSEGKSSFISDTNSELITFYKQLKSNKEELIDRIRAFRNNEVAYYRVRAQQPVLDVDIAARFYYLNRTCFNGLFRVNKEGSFNVPYGFRDIKLIDKALLEQLHCSLQGASITCCDFEKALTNVKSGDLVFLDPPYTVAHNKNGFIEYNQKIFSWEDQERLSQSVKNIIKRDAYFIMTNAFHDSIKKLYSGVGRHYEVERFSTISGKMDSRFPISEILITNCE